MKEAETPHLLVDFPYTTSPTTPSVLSFLLPSSGTGSRSCRGSSGDAGAGAGAILAGLNAALARRLRYRSPSNQFADRSKSARRINSAARAPSMMPMMATMTILVDSLDVWLFQVDLECVGCFQFRL